MKFGKELEDRLYGEWRFYYIDYDGLKRLLKERADSLFSDEDESVFALTLEREMEKVFDFRDVKGGELTRHVQHCETVVKNMDLTDPTARSNIEAEIGRINFELTQLAAFTRLNYTGFLKILKKHDKYTRFMLKPMFMMRLNSKPIYLENLDSLILRLSKLYDILRHGREISVPTDNEPGLNFVRKTAKYWVHPDNVTELKCLILKYLPVYVFKEEQMDPAISSVYLDDEQMSLYHGRLEKTEGAEAIRLRWYGRDSPSTVFVERKTHREDWTGEVSVKSRFSIKEKHLNAFLSGEYTMDKALFKMRQEGRSQDEVTTLEELCRQVQTSVLSKGLKPVVRTFYNRTAFQLPGDARVRISLDTELAMIRECGRARGNWRRSDVGCDYPFRSVDPSDIVLFPHAILEVKLQTQVGLEPPRWVQDLVQGHLVEAVPKFSKFIHGCAVLLEEKVSLFPFWLPQMGIDIRKPGPEPEAIEDVRDGKRRDPLGKDGSPAKTSIRSLDQLPGALLLDVGEPDKQPLLSPKQSQGLGPSKKSKFMSSILGRGRPSSGNQAEKRIAIPVRIEPKVFFANERTFLSWLHFSIFLGGISSALIGLGNDSARTMGLVFATVSVLFSLYALWLFQWRAYMIRRRTAGPYDDRFGPTILVAVFLLAMLSSFYFGIK